MSSRGEAEQTDPVDAQLPLRLTAKLRGLIENVVVAHQKEMGITFRKTFPERTRIYTGLFLLNTTLWILV